MLLFVITKAKKAKILYGEYLLFHTGVLDYGKALSFGHKHHMEALSAAFI